HALGDDGKGLFLHISPFQSLTGANADRWISCVPGSETALALGLVNQLLQRGKGEALPESVRISVRRIVAEYTVDKVIEQTGIDRKDFQQVLTVLYQAGAPLVLGTGAGGVNTLQTNMGANLLNLVLDPELSLVDFDARHRVEIADTRADVVKFITALGKDPVDLLLLNNVNPAYVLPPETGFTDILKRDAPFVVSFSNFMDETAALADLVFPVQLPLESWDEYSGKADIISTLQPAMGRLTDAPHIGDVFLDAAFDKNRPAKDYKRLIFDRLLGHRHFVSKSTRVDTIRQGGMFESIEQPKATWRLSRRLTDAFHWVSSLPTSLVFMAVPSNRFLDGRGANRSWLCEAPDPLTQVAWQTPVRVHPETLRQRHLSQGDVIRMQSKWGRLEAPVYATESVRPGLLVMDLGQGHTAYGRYAENMGRNPVALLPPQAFEHVSGAPDLTVTLSSIYHTGASMELAHTDGSRFQHKRKIALTVDVRTLTGEDPHGSAHGTGGLSMNDFPLVLPVPDSHDEKRDIYPAHRHDTYRWAMTVDLDKCIGCGACSVACYAENNIGVVGKERIIEQREMSWIQIQRYHDPDAEENIIFFPLLCQHCDSAPCESVCPVYASHHSKEGLNNQIYNRCIGTRFCSQNCPYKARRFNWFDWQRPEPLDLQLNPDVTVRSKGVMEKCSFCVQRIKDAHTLAKNEDRKIRDGEIEPACAQTCPTGAFTFGNILDKDSRVRKLADDPRAYQAMGYLNTKPAVIYLKKVIRDI
ncbi:MAG: 4Fe-4S dicluster domain-containing protein, partial [Desulfobacterales bacterium]